MSWSMSAKGTEEAVIRALAGQKVHGGNAEEQTVFDDCRSRLIELVKKSQRPSPAPDGAPSAVAVHDVSASGHGVFVGQFRVSSEWVYLT